MGIATIWRNITETTPLYEKVQQLPSSIQQEIGDYVDYLFSKYSTTGIVKPRAGCMKGTFSLMSDDFNAPLDDFKDYR